MTRSHVLPTGPPPEVLDEIEAAWERAQAPVDGVAIAWGELVALPV